MSPAAEVLPATSLTLETGNGKPPILYVDRVADLESARTWLADHRAAIRTELLRHGHLLVRGLPARSAEDFARIRDVVMPARAVYREKATPRSDYGDDVYSSTDLPPSQAIHLHNENSYTLDFPGLLAFCCIVAPDEGGATTVADVRQVLASLPGHLVDRFRAVGWLLTRNYHDHVGLPWKVAFGTESRAAVDEYCASHLIGCDWRGGTGLRTTQRRSASVHHPVTGEEVWFNHASFWSRWSLDSEVLEVLVDTYGEDGLPFDTAYGDGEPLSAGDVTIINDAYDRATRRERWQQGDILLVDNILSAHGRDAYRGERRILVAMGEPTPLDRCRPAVAPAATPVR